MLGITARRLAGVVAPPGARRASSAAVALTRALDDSVAVITLAAPQKRNPLEPATVEALHAALDEAHDASVVVLTHEGPVFSAGHNLKHVAALQAENRFDELSRGFQRTGDLARRLAETGSPTIAAVHGLATAAGCQLALSCDLAVASHRAAFATPGSSVGLFCSTPGVAVARAAPRKLAMEMLLTGKPISAARALGAGMINRVVGPEDAAPGSDTASTAVLDAALEMAASIAAHPKAVISLGKRTAAAVAASPTLEAQYALASDAMTVNTAMDEAREGISAFLQKRPPAWRRE